MTSAAQPLSDFRQHLSGVRNALAGMLGSKLKTLAELCVSAWEEPELLDYALAASLPHLKGCRLLYALSCDGIQVSSNVSNQDIDTSGRGQDLSDRPFLEARNRHENFALSSVYLSQYDQLPCITALHLVTDDSGKVLGCIAADFTLQDIPHQQNTPGHNTQWRQIKGDPAIRQNLFAQERVTSAMDEQLDTVNNIVTELMIHRGMFHVKLHYSSSRATLWLYDDPHRYRLHVLEEIIDPEVCLAYPVKSYPTDAKVDAACVRKVFARFKALRDADNTIYLRSASLNIVNGMVGLTFSCDGSHYMSAAEFIEKDDTFWFGEPNSCPL